jgi:2-keto-3-deoxy-6-phosphogluconate aldolase
MAYQRNRARVDKALRKSGVVVVMNKDHVKKPEDLVMTMWEVYEAGLVAECTFRIDEGLLREGMKEIVKKREGCPEDNPFVLGVGSIINPKELASAIEMGFDMIVAPATVMGGYGEGKDFVRIAHQANCFVAPAIFTPTELNYFIEREDGLIPDAIKIFPARSHGPKGFADLLAPYVRDRHKGRIIMPTGAVDYETGPQYIQAISSRGYTPVLGMSAPLQLVSDRKKPGDLATVRESLAQFRQKFDEARKKLGV